MTENKRDDLQVLLWRRHKENGFRLMFRPTKLVRTDKGLKVREAKFMIAIDSDKGSRAFLLSMDEAMLLAKVIERRVDMEQERLRVAYEKYRQDYIERKSKKSKEEEEINIVTTGDETSTVNVEVS